MAVKLHSILLHLKFGGAMPTLCMLGMGLCWPQLETLWVLGGILRGPQSHRYAFGLGGRVGELRCGAYHFWGWGCQGSQKTPRLHIYAHMYAVRAESRASLWSLVKIGQCMEKLWVTMCFVASSDESSTFEGLPRTHLLQFRKSDHKF